MASFDTLQKLAQHPDWLPPRSDVRVFLGEPGAPEANKTTVEPGNTFSPGMLTFGVTWWLRDPVSGEMFAPETAPLDALRWRYEGGYLPILHCEVEFKGLRIVHSLFQDGTARERSESVCARIALTNEAAAPRSMQLFVALRSLGPAGGMVNGLTVGADGRSLCNAQRNLPLLALAEQPAAIGCGVGDAYPLAMMGVVPSETQSTDPDGWCFGLARFDLSLSPDESSMIRLDCPQPNYGGLRHEFPGAAVRVRILSSSAPRHMHSWGAEASA